MGMPWVTGDNVQVRVLCRAKQDAHLVDLVDALEPLQAKSKTIPLIQGTSHAPFYVHDSVGDTVDVDNHLSNRHDSVNDSSVVQHEVLVLDHHGHLVSIVLWNVVRVVLAGMVFRRWELTAQVQSSTLKGSEDSR